MANTANKDYEKRNFFFLSHNSVNPLTAYPRRPRVRPPLRVQLFLNFSEGPVASFRKKQITSAYVIYSHM